MFLSWSQKHVEIISSKFGERPLFIISDMLCNLEDKVKYTILYGIEYFYSWLNFFDF